MFPRHSQHVDLKLSVFQNRARDSFLMHIQGLGEGERRGKVRSEFISFFVLEQIQINSSCADEREICL